MIAPKPIQSRTVILVIWLAPQVLSLVLSASRIRLSYRWIDPPPKWAVEQLLVAQMLLASLVLFHCLKDWVITLMLFASGAVMLTLAYAIAIGEANLATSLVASAILLIALRGLTTIFSGRLSQAIVNLWMWGGMVLMYGAMEFAGRSSNVFYSPMMVLLALARQENASINGWFVLIGVFATTAVIDYVRTSNASLSRQFIPR